MPAYDYVCDACKKVHEIVHKMSDEPPTECPSCKKHALRRSYQSVSLQFQGKGFYSTDYNTSDKKTEEKPSHCNNKQCGCK